MQNLVLVIENWDFCSFAFYILYITSWYWEQVFGTEIKYNYLYNFSHGKKNTLRIHFYEINNMNLYLYS